MWSLDLATDKLYGSEAGVRSAFVPQVPLPSRPGRELASLTLVIEQVWVLLGGPAAMHRVRRRDLSLRVECIQRGWGGQEPAALGDPLAQGVRRGILNLSLGTWGRDPKAGSPLTCAHFGSSRSSPAAMARGLGSACEAPGHGRGRRLWRSAERLGWAAPARRDGDWNGAAVSLRPSCPAPPRRLRPPLPRGLPGLVVPSLASVLSSQRS